MSSKSSSTKQDPLKKNSNKTKINQKDSDRVITDDPRFAHVHDDPRFIRPKRRDMKVKIDERFKQMLNTKDFSDTPKVDKYGRNLPSNYAEQELRRFYTLGEKNEKDKPDFTDDVSDPDLSQSTYDRARGEADDQQSQDEAENIPRGAQTHRFACVNLDWDNLKSVDLMKVFSAFKPEGSFIRSVKIFPSEFGKERLEKEQRYGPPKEIFKKQESDEDLSSSEDAEDDIDYGKINIKKIIKEGVAEEFDENALRKYQLERLKYYYAIVDCDTVKTARAIYEQCDGTEFERSSNFFDLRFVPDGMEFNDVPREVDECYEAPDVYKPIDFTTNVLQHSRAKLTWDADDPDRVRLTRHSFTKDDIDNMDFKIYLASTDEESEGDNDGIKQKYKNLLAEIEEEKEVDEDLEVTFAPALTEVNNEEDDELEETTIEKYLRKQKEKKKLKKAAKEASRQLEIGSDDDALDNSSRKSNSKKKPDEEQEIADKQRAELELLMDDSADGNKHFDLKEIIKAEKKKRKRKKRNNEKEADEDNFEINANDPRFAALLENHHFAIDPTNPHFKKTKAMQKLLEERQRRQVLADSEEIRDQESWNTSNTFKDASLSSLVNSVKRKTAVISEKNRRGKRNKFG